MPFDSTPQKPRISDTKRVLLVAAETVRIRGLARGKGAGPNGEVCALRAISLAAGLDGWCSAQDHPATSLLREHLKLGPNSLVWNWNDFGTVTEQRKFLGLVPYERERRVGAEDVANALEEAAKLADRS